MNVNSLGFILKNKLMGFLEIGKRSSFKKDGLGGGKGTKNDQ